MNIMATKEMTKSSLIKKRKRSSSESASFSSLPYDLTLNCLARTSRTHAPILSLVSKTFRLILTSPDLEAARSHIRKKPEKCLYVCLKLNNNPTWFGLSTTHKKKLIPLSSFPYQHPNSSTVVSIGSNIYLIGGFFKGKRKRTRRVFVLDCKSHQWRKLPKMCVSRKEPAACVIDGKICVIGGCSKRYDNKENYEESYDPKTQIWEPLSPIQESSKIHYPYGLESEVYHYMSTLGLVPNACLVYLKKKNYCYLTKISNGKLVYSNFNNRPWLTVSGLEGLSSTHLISVANPSRGSKVTVWWMKVEFGPKECFVKTEIWCAKISLTICPWGILQGLIEWSENVFTFNGCESDSDFFLHSACVTHVDQ